MTPLSNLATIRTGLSTSGRSRLGQGPHSIQVINVRNVTDRGLQGPYDEEQTTDGNLGATDGVKEASVMLTSRGSRFTAAVCPGEVTGYAFSNNLLCIDAHHYDPHVLAAHLNSPAGQAELEARASGSTIKGIRAKDLATLPVPNLTADQQKQLSAFISTTFQAHHAAQEAINQRWQVATHLISTQLKEVQQ